VGLSLGVFVQHWHDIESLEKLLQLN
jgi:hypothetical protein